MKFPDTKRLGMTVLKRTTTPAQRFFNHWARTYERALARYDYTVPETVFNAVWPYVADRQGLLRLLDVGIGTGLSSQPFRDTGQVYITGVDVSEKMLALCRARGVADELHHRNVAYEPLPGDDQSLDIVIAGGVLEFIDDAERLFEEISRVLRPGGILAVTHEMPETRHLYPTGFLDGILAQEEHRVVVQRSFTYRGLPRLYRKYLHSPRIIEDLCIHNRLSLLQSKSFTAYQWSPEQAVVYNLIIAQRV